MSEQEEPQEQQAPDDQTDESQVDATESEASAEPADAPQTDEAAEEQAPEEQAADESQSEPEQPSLPIPLPEPEQRLALLEAIIFVSEDPLPVALIAEGLGFPAEIVKEDLAKLQEQFAHVSRGLEVRAVAGGYKMFTKAEHHDSVRQFVKTLRPKLKLSLPALETLSVIAYKQPVTVPEIQAVRGVSVAGTIHTLLRHKLIATAGRKKVVGKPMMYKTTKEFLVQFGLNDLNELPSLKEMEELSRAALGDEDETPETVEAADVAEIEGGALAEAEAEATSEANEQQEAAEEQAEAVAEQATGPEPANDEQADAEPADDEQSGEDGSDDSSDRE